MSPILIQLYREDTEWEPGARAAEDQCHVGIQWFVGMLSGKSVEHIGPLQPVSFSMGPSVVWGADRGTS